MVRIQLISLFLASLFFSSCAGPKQTTGTVDGISYEVRGSGPVLVLIHGSNLDRRIWESEVGWLSESYRVLTYDMRGHGQSVFPDTTYSNYGDLLSLLDELNAEEATLLGISAGAQVALDVALVAPERVTRLVLVSPSLTGFSPQQMPEFLDDLISALRAGDFALADQILLDSPIMAVPAKHRKRVASIVKENSKTWKLPYSLVEQLSPPTLERLAEITQPTLILVGDQDAAAVEEQGELLHDKLPNSTLKIVRGAGHLLHMNQAAFRAALEMRE